jgi:hypothetical protein
MPLSALPETLTAIFNALNVAAITGAPFYAKVFDNVVPQGTGAPYLVVTSPIDTPNDTMGTYGSEIVVQVHIWTTQPASGQATKLAEQVRALLDWGKGRPGDPRLVVPGYQTIRVGWESTADLGTQTINGINWQHFVVFFRVEVRAAVAA